MAAGGGGGKVDEFQPHPVKDQLPGVDYCVTSSPSWRMRTDPPLLLSNLFSYYPFFFPWG